MTVVFFSPPFFQALGKIAPILGAAVTPGILPFALRARAKLFKIAPDNFVWLLFSL